MIDPNREGLEKLTAIFSKFPNETVDQMIDRLRPVFAKHALRSDPDRWVRWFMNWHRVGLPHVMVDAKLAASFMATEIPREFAADVPSPWDAFMVTIPHGIIGRGETTVLVYPFQNADDDAHPQSGMRMTSIFFQDRHPLGADGKGMIWNICEEWSAFAGGDLSDVTRDLLGGRISALARQRLQLVMRFVAGACLELANRGSTSSGAPASRVLGWSRAGKPPKLWVTRLSRPVRVDVREYVRACSVGNRGSISVQYMRRGHWRNQAHGPGLLLRKFIPIEPHWVGPEDAPIAVRPHILNASEKGAAE